MSNRNVVGKVTLSSTGVIINAMKNEHFSTINRLEFNVDRQGFPSFSAKVEISEKQVWNGALHGDFWARRQPENDTKLWSGLHGSVTSYHF